MKILIFLSLLNPQILTTWGNFPQDLAGPMDSRMAGISCNSGPCIWGRADSADNPIVFHPPAGSRVRILGLSGDLIAWIKTIDGRGPAPNSAAGVLGGFLTSSSGTDPNCDNCSSGCGLYVQDSITPMAPKTRLSFDYQDVNLLLDADNTLHARLAEFLNTTGAPIHLELTYRIRYLYESKGE